MKNKILTISIVFILLSFVFINNNAFASLPQYEFAEAPDGLIDAVNELDVIKAIENPNYIVFFRPNSSIYDIWLFPNSDDFKAYFDGSYLRFSLSNTHRIELNKSDFSLSRIYTTENYSKLQSSFFVENEMYYMYSTFDIYSDDTYTDFFYKAPVKEKQTVLTPILEKVEMTEPIITTIVGLAKLLIPFLACLIGFWKVWQLLLKILHRS